MWRSVCVIEPHASYYQLVFIFMSSKQIIIIVVVIFIALVGYKIISSHIQENKEKSILQEKLRLQELEKEPLNRCIENINNDTERKIKDDYELFYKMATPEFQSSCESAHTKDYCKPPSIQEFNKEIQDYRDKAKIEIEECYKHYK